MKERILGRTGLKVREVGFGAWAIGGNSYGATDDRESLQALRRAIDLGATFIDSADIYGFGHSEELVAKALKGKRLSLVVATKGGWNFYETGRGVHADFSSAHIRRACEESLRRLGTDHIDLYQLHNPKVDQIRDLRTYEALDALKREGKIRFYGISVHTIEEGLAVLEAGKADAIQVVYNLIEQAPRRELFARAQAANVGVIAREPLACGLLTGKYAADHKFAKDDHRRSMRPAALSEELARAAKFESFFKSGPGTRVQRALAFVLAEPSVSVVIPGAKTTAQVDENMQAAGVALSPSELQEARRIFDEDALLSGETVSR